MADVTGYSFRIDLNETREKFIYITKREINQYGEMSESDLEACKKAFARWLGEAGAIMDREINVVEVTKYEP